MPGVDADGKVGRALLYSGKAAEAVPYLRRAVQLEPASKAVNLSLGQALLETGNATEALTFLRHTLSIDRVDFAANSALGRALQQLGRFDEAVESFQAAMKRDPLKPSPYFGIAFSQQITETDRPFIQQMEALLPGSPSKARSLINYALGKAFDDLGEYASAIRHFDEANRIEAAERVRTGMSFNRGRFLSTLDIITKTFDESFFGKHLELGNPSDLPVLIVGMIRSGTTLTEQILTSHPEVGTAGELPFWRDHGLRLVADAARSTLERSTSEPVVNEYLKVLGTAGPGARRVTDKMPLNFMALGPIHLLFPRARIIHCRRDPVDTCLSVYFTPYRNGPEFAFNRADIVLAYQSYQRLMDHWRRALPDDVFLDLDYEQLVADRERVSRQAIEFLGLEWNEACLTPEANATQVATPSMWQVRQPIYRSSTGRWKNYEPWLGEFSELL